MIYKGPQEQNYKPKYMNKFKEQRTKKILSFKIGILQFNKKSQITIVVDLLYKIKNPYTITKEVV